MNKDHQLLAEAYGKVLKEEADFEFTSNQPKEEVSRASHGGATHLTLYTLYKFDCCVNKYNPPRLRVKPNLSQFVFNKQSQTKELAKTTKR